MSKNAPGSGSKSTGGFRKVGARWLPATSKAVAVERVSSELYKAFLLEEEHKIFPDYDRGKHYIRLDYDIRGEEHFVLNEQDADGGLELPPGIWLVNRTFEVFLTEYPVAMDDLVYTPLARVVEEDIRLFFDKKKVYKDLGLRHKRSALLHGPPGNGKTTTVLSLATKLCEEIDVAVLIVAGNIDLHSLDELRGALSGQRVILVLEELLSRQGTEALQEFLDGYSSWEGYLISTTNDLREVDETVGRPGRFDLVKEVGDPDDAERTAYLRALLGEDFEESQARVTKGYSYAYIKEAVLRRMLYNIPLHEAVQTIRKEEWKPFGV